MSDRGGFAEQPIRPSYRVDQQRSIDAARDASRGREWQRAWYESNQDVKAAEIRSQGWEAQLPDRLRLRLPSASATAEVSQNQYMTAAQLEADPMKAMDEATKLSRNNPLLNIPDRDEYGFAIPRSRTERPAMPEAVAPLELSENPRVALAQVRAILNATRALISGSLDRMMPGRRTAVSEGATTAKVDNYTSEPDPLDAFLRDSLARNAAFMGQDQGVQSERAQAMNTDPALTSVLDRISEKAGDQPGVVDATPAFTPVAEAPAVVETAAA